MEKISFDCLFTDYYVYIYRIILYKIGNSYDAEDLTSNVFLKAYNAFDRYDPTKASAKTWLYVIAQNVLKNYYRDRKVNASVEEYSNTLSETDRDITYEAVLLQESRDILAKALNALSDRERLIIIHKYFNDKSSEEIAQELKISSGNVRIIVSRALKKLKDIFKKEGYDRVRWYE